MKKIILLILCFNYYLFSDEILNIDLIKEKIKDKTVIEQTIILEKYITDNPENISLYTLKAEIEIKDKDFIGAKNTLTKAMKLDNTNIKTLNLLGMCFFYLDKLDDASSYFQKVLSFDKNNQFANNYISLIDPFSQNKNIVTNSKNEITDINIKKLDEDYKALNDKEKRDYVYLLNQKEVNIFNDHSMNYSIHCVIKILTSDGANVFRNFNYTYNSYEFNPEIIKVGSYNFDYSFNSIDKKNVVILDKKNPSVTLMYNNGKQIAFPIPDIQVGSIIEYNIHFNSTGKNLSTNISDQFIFASIDKILQSKYILNYPKNLDLKIKIKGAGIKTDETTINDNIKKTFTCTNPQIYNLKNETVTIYDVAPMISISTFKSWNSIAEWYSNLFEQSIIDDKTYKEIFSKIDLKNKTNLEKINIIYQYVQKNINYIGIELAENAMKPHSPAEIYKNKFGDCKDQVLFTIYLLRKLNINASPMLISTLDNGQFDKSIPSPFYFNHVISFIPKQDGITENLFLDTTSSVTPFGNIPSLVQGTNGFLINKNIGEFVNIPLISYTKNRIEDTFIIKPTIVGSGEFEYKSFNTGTYSELIRYSFKNKTKDEIYDYFLKMQKKSSPNLKKENLIIDGINEQSGNVSISYKSNEDNLTNIFFDGKQKVNFSLKDIKSLFNFPSNIQYDYTNNFLFSYKKSLEYIFPEGYGIIEGEIKNTSRENEYLKFEVGSDKISENHFSIFYEISLKKRVIKKEDLKVIDQFLQTIATEVNYSLTIENKNNFDYINFYKELTGIYKKKEVYENYVRKMLELKKNDEVFKICEDAITLFPDDSYFYLINSSLLLDKGNFKDAENILNQALEHNPENPDIYLFLSNVYKKSQNDSDLESILLEANNKFKNNQSLIRELITFYRRTESYGKAVDFLNEIIKNDPNNSYLYGDLGFIYSLNKDFINAEKSLLKAIEINDKNAQSLNNLAWLYCENDKNLKQAIDYSKKACDIEPFNDSYLDTLAEAYFKNKDYDLAIEAIQKAIKVNPNYTYLQLQLDKIEKAKKLINDNK